MWSVRKETGRVKKYMTVLGGRITQVLHVVARVEESDRLVGKPQLYDSRTTARNIARVSREVPDEPDPGPVTLVYGRLGSVRRPEE